MFKKFQYIRYGSDMNVCMFLGSGGSGKSTAMKHLSLSWADNSIDNIKDIDFTFHVSLDMVQNDDDLENIIVQQHKGLKGNDVQPAEIKAILRNQAKKKIVIILDGHDEYQPGTNSDIDHLIKREYLRNCGIVLSSQKCYYFSIFCQKLHENERIWTPGGGGARVPGAPPWIRQCIIIKTNGPLT